jgi:VWFA-related protein
MRRTVLRKETAWILAALASGAIALGAQEPPAPPAPELGATIDVRVVNVEAVVTDRKGERVRGLSAADFRLLVDGREVPVDYFTEIADGGVASPSVASAPGAPAAASPLPAGKAGTSYLVFIDDSFAIAPQRNLLLTGIAEDLRLGPEDRMAIVAFDGKRLDLLSDWEGDRETLLRTLDEARRRPANGLQQLVALRQYAADGAEGFRGSGDFFSEVHSVAEAAAASMRGVSASPGRKVLLLLTSGWPSLPKYALGPQACGPANAMDLARLVNLFEPITGTANLLGYTIYPVYPPKAVADSNWADAARDVVAPGEPRFRPGFISNSWELGSNETMTYLARETGGEPIFSSWRQSAFARVERDTRSYYWLGFTPEWHGNGRSHQVRVEARRRGLRVRSRGGFADLTPGMRASLRTDSLLLFGNVPEVREISIETGAPKRSGWSAVELPVTLVIPADLLTPVPVEGGYEVRARVSMSSVDRWGGDTGRRDLLVQKKLTALPGSGEATRFETLMKLRKVEQRLLFAVQDDAGEGQGRAELDFKP